MIRLLLLSLLSMGCQTVRTVAVKQMAPVFVESGDELQKSRSWDQFKAATPANLQFAEVLLTQDPENSDFLGSLTKGFTGYALAINDTEYLDDALADRTQSRHMATGIDNLGKALRYGLRFMALHDITYERVVGGSKTDSIDEILDEELDFEDKIHFETAFYLGAAWMMYANYQKDNMQILTQIPIAYGLIDWACKHKPDFQNGLCPTFEAIYHMARPPILGGKPDLGKKILVDARKKYKDNLAIPLMYIQWYLLPRGDGAEFARVKAEMKPAIIKWQKNIYLPGARDPDTLDTAYLNLFNAMAVKRLGILEKYQEDHF